MLQRLLIFGTILFTLTAKSQVHYSNLQFDTPLVNASSKAGSSSKIASTTLNLPFIEDFSGYTGVADTTKFISGGGTYVNARYPVLPPTINAATFDGIKEDGEAYDFGTDPFVDGATDELTSCNLDLSGLHPDSNVVMSFYWQKGSILENNAPDDNDSIRLQFKDQSGIWSTMWVELGDATVTDSSTTDFAYVTVTIDSLKYFHNAFQFRFQSYGRRTGRFDVWSIDYIYIDSQRSSLIPFPELGFSTAPTSVIKGYQTVPYKHFLQNISTFLADSVCAKVYNQQSSPVLLNDTLMQFSEKVRTVSIENTTTTGGNASLSPGQNINVCWTPSIDSITNKFSGLDMDSTYILKYKLNINTGDVFRQNDSVVGITKLDNFYAYDDGTVEGGVGIGKNQGRVMVEFDIAEDDTLIALDILFPRHSPEPTSKGIKLLIMDELEGINGGVSDNVLYQPFQTLRYGTVLNEYYRYDLSANPVPIQAGKIYVGYQQFTNNVIYAGLDGNTDNLDKVHIDVNGTWIPLLSPNDSTKGSIMIRPVFDHYILTASEKELEKLSITIFPNPTSNSFTTSLTADEVYIYNISGQEVFRSIKSNRNSFDVTNLRPGTYFVKILKDNRLATKKLIIN